MLSAQHARANYNRSRIMADALFLSLWFPSFSEMEMMPRTLSVLRQFPFSTHRPGISYLSIQPVNWSEPTVMERRFRPGLEPDQTVAIAGEFLHSDYAYLFEAYWDLWVPTGENQELVPAPVQVKIIAHGADFEEHAYQQVGHVEIDFGLDSPFLYEEQALTPVVESRFRANVQKLVALTQALEKSCGISGRVLWSESDENLAQKLIERLQRVQ